MDDLQTGQEIIEWKLRRRCARDGNTARKAAHDYGLLVHVSVGRDLRHGMQYAR